MNVEVKLSRETKETNIKVRVGKWKTAGKEIYSTYNGQSYENLKINR